jgi:hypothetical protein
MRLT